MHDPCNVHTRIQGENFFTFGVSTTRSSASYLRPAMDKALPQVIRDMLASYEEVGGMNNTDGLNLPSKRAMHQICEDLLQLLFPGFHDEEALHKKSLPVLTRHRVTSMAERLEEQVCKSLRIGDPECPTERASRILVQFLEGLPAVRRLLQTDIEAGFAGDPAALNREEVILSYPWLEAIAIQRLAHTLYQSEVPMIPRMMTEWAHSRTGIDIHPGAQIGTHFFIDHGTGVVVGETSVIGSHVKMYQGVALIGRSLSGGQTLRGKKRHPTIEDHVTVYAGTTIMGADTVIGAGSTIGANVFLTHSVPPNSLVVYEDKRLNVLNKANKRRNTAHEWTI